MEINKIKYFRAIYETGSMRKAAELMKMSPGSLSKSMKSLEEELEIKLFIPNGRNIIPTEEATQVYLQSQNLLNEYENFLQNSQPKKQEKQIIKIGSWEIFTTYFMGRFCRDEIHSSKDIIEVLEKTPGELEKALLAGEIDMGVTYAPIAHPKLELLKIGQFHFGIYGNKSYHDTPLKNLPFAIPITKTGASLVDIKDLDHWPISQPRQVKYRFETLEAALETSRLGLSVIHCPHFIANLQNESLKKSYQLTLLEANDSLHTYPLDIFITLRKTTQESNMVKKLAKAIRVYCLGGIH